MTNEQPLVDWAKGFDEAVAEAARTLAKVVSVMKASHDRVRATRTPEQIERQSQIRYAYAVAAERRAGLAFVAQKTRQVRRELGLPPEQGEKGLQG